MAKFIKIWVDNNFKKNKTNKRMCFRSQWEINFASFLENNPRVVEWEFDFPFKYFDKFVSNKISVYKIDFKVRFSSNEVIYFEVKPVKTLTERVKTKSIKYKKIHTHNMLKNYSKFSAVNSFCKRSNSQFILVNQSRDKKFEFYKWDSKNKTVQRI